MSTKKLLQKAIEELLLEIGTNPSVLVLYEYESIKQLHRVGDSCFHQYRDTIIHNFQDLSSYTDNKKPLELFHQYLSIRDQEV